MKKVILIMFLLIAGFASAQQSMGSHTGYMENESMIFCAYDECYMKNRLVGTISLDQFSITYEKGTNIYHIHISTKESEAFIRVKFKEGNDRSGYIYEGVEENSGMRVAIFCKNKLSLYTKNFGFDSVTQIKDFEKEGINFIFPKMLVISSVAVIKN
jgi:hypothetical protein